MIIFLELYDIQIMLFQNIVYTFIISKKKYVKVVWQD